MRMISNWLRAACAILALSLAATANAQTWPTKAVTIVLPYAPGGGTDAVGRLLAKTLTEKLGQPFIIENRPGATGNIGTAHVARSDPDGYTLLLGIASNFSINHSLFKTLPYKQSDLRPVTIVVDYPNALIVNQHSPFKSVQDLVTYARANPGKLNYGSSGYGSMGHLSLEMFSRVEGMKLTNIVYKGSAPSLVALLAGEVDMVMDALPVYISQIDAGKLRALAVSTDARSPMLPNVPTMREAGVENFSIPGWFALATPAATPDAVVRSINEAFHAVLQDPAIVSALAKEGYRARGDSLDATQAFVTSESNRWAAFIKANNISLN